MLNDLLATHLGQLTLANLTMQTQIADLQAQLQTVRQECDTVKQALAEKDGSGDGPSDSRT